MKSLDSLSVRSREWLSVLTVGSRGDSLPTPLGMKCMRGCLCSLYYITGSSTGRPPGPEVIGDSRCTFLRGHLPSGLGDAIIRRMSGGGNVPESFANAANRGILVQNSRRGCSLAVFSQEARVRMYVLQQRPCGLKLSQKRLREGAATSRGSG